MTIKPNVLQGAFFWVFGASTASMCVLMLLSVMMFFAPPKADFGEFPEIPVSNIVGLTVLTSSLVVWAAAYSIQRRHMLMTLPAGTKASLFALGVATNASVGLVVYLWARAFL